jgi:hypothetical protein
MSVLWPFGETLRLDGFSHGSCVASNALTLAAYVVEASWRRCLPGGGTASLCSLHTRPCAVCSDDVLSFLQSLQAATSQDC